MRAVLGVALAAAVSSLGAHAAAYCRTTTCDPKYDDCKYEGNCNVSGQPLFWKSACVGYGVQKDGTAVRGISAEQTTTIVATGFQQWMQVDCGGAPPSITVARYTQSIECGVPEYNQDAPNANVWMYRNDGWPYPQGPDKTLALTTVTFNAETGEIFDVDVEINAAETPLTTGLTDVIADLPSIVTHEAGHFLGLSHSSVAGATMSTSYEFGKVDLRSLALDDVQGICEIYPPGRNAGPCNIEPRHGFSSRCAPEKEEDGCGCRAPGTSRGASGSGRGWVMLLLAGTALARRRRRR